MGASGPDSLAELLHFFFHIWLRSTAAWSLLVFLASVSTPHLHWQLGNGRHNPFINSNCNVMGSTEKWVCRSGVCKQCANISFKCPVQPLQGAHSQRFTMQLSTSACSAVNMDNWMIPHVQYILYLYIYGSDKRACEKTIAALLDNLCSCIKAQMNPWLGLGACREQDAANFLVSCWQGEF